MASGTVESAVGWLQFDPDEHRYYVDGVEIPSVSRILRFLSRETYGEIDEEILRRAAERGTAVHRATELIDLGEGREVRIDGAYVGYVIGYQTFLREHGVAWDDVERAMFHPEKRYAGTIDRFGIVDGAPSLVDIKTSATIHKTLVKAQLNGYEAMRRANGMKAAEKLYCLQLLDGDYRLYPCAFDSSEFDACFALHTATERKHPRGEIA